MCIIYICKTSFDVITFLMLQPPILPCRLQQSTFGRIGLNRRVRYGNGCFSVTYRHSKYFVYPSANQQQCSPYFFLFLRKEVIQPHLPIRLPCYDFTPVTGSAFDGSLLRWATGFGHFRLPWCDGRCVQDPGTYSPQHSDLRLLAIPASCSRVADYSPNWDGLFEIRS